MEGKHFRNMLDRTSDGNHSIDFQYPEDVPLSWPIRIVIGRRGVRSAATSRSRSATHFDSEYPLPVAAAGGTPASRMAGVSGMSACSREYVQITNEAQSSLMATLAELQKIILGGSLREDDKARFIKLRTPRILGS